MCVAVSGVVPMVLLMLDKFSSTELILHQNKIFFPPLFTFEQMKTDFFMRDFFFR